VKQPEDAPTIKRLKRDTKQRIREGWNVAKPDTVTVTLGDGLAVIRRKGITVCVVAEVLGCERDAEGAPTVIYLDRLVHRIGETSFGDWDVSGAISTVLRRRGSVPAAVAGRHH